MLNTSSLQRFKEHCPGFRHYYALVDCAIDERIYPQITQSSCDSSTLFWHGIGETLKAASPHIVELGSDPFTQWLFQEGWGNSWCIFLASNKPMTELVQHFRRLAKVRGPNNENWYFRYCDPRYMRVLLPLCDSAQLNRILGDTGVFWMEGDTPEKISIFQRKQGKLQFISINVDGSDSHVSVYDPTEQPGSGTTDNLLKIRQDQCEQFTHAVRREFVRKMAATFLEKYPDRLKSIAPDQLFRLVDAAISQMHQLGAKSRQDAYHFINACILFGWDFLQDDSQKWIRTDYLENSELGNISLRLEALYYYSGRQSMMDGKLEA
ncbi:DUF4123 domain-containing protein [Hahella sp. CR1]|uniref:DUF4123 domain-containing protein n=1 Tax=Hahella sp. CR1 TaxID=2992807 RepID=UPI0024429BD6|nr:DUF4123 domain-containing protein [Hahella sp. CR1]MDG9670845.1 DUF4123 domain-containing protein [Hahella sp. CR1]